MQKKDKKIEGMFAHRAASIFPFCIIVSRFEAVSSANPKEKIHRDRHIVNNSEECGPHAFRRSNDLFSFPSHLENRPPNPVLSEENTFSVRSLGNFYKSQ